MKAEKLLTMLGEMDVKYVSSTGERLTDSIAALNRAYKKEIYARTAACLAAALFAPVMVYLFLWAYLQLASMF